MKKIIVFIISMFIIINVYALEINSKRAILINLNDDTVLFEKNSEEKTSIASLTKIMTAITIIETSDLNDEILIKYDMLKNLDGYVKVGLRSGMKITVEELLYALMLPSAGDAAQSLAIYKSGSIDEFVNLMNYKAEEMGALNTHFTNPVGMDDDDNYSTAKDLSIILKHALKNETFKTIFETDEYYLKSLNKKIYKTLKERKIDTGSIKGSKTGYTSAAGRCLASTSTIDGVDYLFVNLNANPNTLDYVTDAINTYDYYSSNYGYKDIVNKGDILQTLKVKGSKEKEYQILAPETISKYLTNEFKKEDIKIKYSGLDTITRKIKKGDKLGTIEFIYNGDTLYTLDVNLEKDIKFYNYILYIGIILIFIIILMPKNKKKRKKKTIKKQYLYTLLKKS